MKPHWTPRLDDLLLVSARQGKSHAEIARLVRRATRGSFTPHRSTVCRRLIQLEAVSRPRKAAESEQASTRVDAVEIPARVRAPLAVRAAPPPVSVLALPAESVERYGVGSVLSDLLFAVPPGWAWEVVDPAESRADAIACARHRVRLLEESYWACPDSIAFEVVEDSSDKHPVVLLRRSGMAARLLVLVVIRFRRVAE